MAGKPRGLPKSGGRTKGTPNKESHSLLAKCERAGVDPFQVMLNFCNDPDKQLAMAAAKEVSSYLYPKRKSLEHSGSLDPKMMEAAEQVAALNKEQQIELLETELKKLKGE